MYASVNEPKKTSPVKIAAQDKQKRDRVQLRASTVRIYSPSKKPSSGKPAVARSINLREVVRREISGPVGAESSACELTLLAPSEPSNFDRLVVKVSSLADHKSAEILVNIREYVLLSHDMKTKYGAAAEQYFQPESIDWWCSHIERILVLKLGKRGKLLMTVSKASIETMLSESLPPPDRTSRGGNRQNFPSKIKQAVSNNLMNLPQHTNIGIEGNLLRRHDDQMSIKEAGDACPDQTEGDNIQNVHSVNDEQEDTYTPHKHHSDAATEGESVSQGSIIPISDLAAVKDNANYDMLRPSSKHNDDSNVGGRHQGGADEVLSNEKAEEHVYDDEFEAEEGPSSSEIKVDKEMECLETPSKELVGIQSSGQSGIGYLKLHFSPDDPVEGSLEIDQQDTKDSEDDGYDDEFEDEQSIRAHENFICSETVSLVDGEEQSSSGVQATTDAAPPSNSMTHISSIRGLVLDAEDDQSAENSYQEEFEDEPSVLSSEVDSEVKEVLTEMLSKIGQ